MSALVHLHTWSARKRTRTRNPGAVLVDPVGMRLRASASSISWASNCSKPFAAAFSMSSSALLCSNLRVARNRGWR